VSDLPATTTVLQWLREQQRLTGSKEGCAEGDCGACTVVIGELCDGQLRLETTNVCIQYLPTLHGKALFTVEYLKQAERALHPVQQAMVDCHGSQCGFCTPGFVMSLWAYYLDRQASGAPADDASLRTALSGNLCRCTGYAPILDAGKQMFDLPAAAFDRDAIVQSLRSLDADAALDAQDFHSPTDLDALLALRKAKPDSTLLAGGTDIGLWTNKQFRELGTLIYTGRVRELQSISASADGLRIGAAVSLNDAYAALSQHYPQLAELWERFASVPIRNAGTLGGNIANGSPIGDSMPWLIAVGAEVVLRSADAARQIPLEDLYLGYMQQSRQPEEIIEAVLVPLPADKLRFRTWKVCKRYDSDISAVCAAFAIWLDDGVITRARVAFGGMAATPKRAAACEAALIGQPWSQATAEQAMAALAGDYAPLSDMRASAEYRQRVARNLLQRFYLETGAAAESETRTRAFFLQEQPA
jgi:xanthine dehydrogenase small subunit